MSIQKVKPANPELWKMIRAFDFDTPMSEYGFTIRLIDENHWTIRFAEKAILEYKKFMYLATISDSMVSPSPVIDAVWHQHLIFTQSYSQFCDMTGKFIQHVPSTHNKEDYKRFRQAKEHTKELYQQNFGEIPSDIWDAETMYDTIGWPKAKMKIRGFVLLGVLGILLALVPAYFALKPLYVHLGPQYFLVMYTILAVVLFFALFSDAKDFFADRIVTVNEKSFIYNLSASEVVYMKTRSLSNVVDDRINQLLNSNKLSEYSGVISAGKAELDKSDLLQFQISGELDGGQGKIGYQELRKRLMAKPVFTTIAGSMNAIDKYFIKSREFGKLFHKHFIILSILFILGAVRVATGIVREKPVMIVLMLVIGTAIAIVFHLRELTRRISKSSIPDLYLKKILSPDYTDEWRYFRLGVAALGASFYLIAHPRIKSDDSSYASNNGSDGSSCGGGSSCGSSCGGSCGGCGGCGS